MSISWTPKVREYSGTATSVAAATEIEIDIGRECYVRIVRLRMKRSAGTAANFSPGIGIVTGWTVNTVDQVWASASGAVGALYDEARTDRWCKTDVNGKLWLRPIPDAGADNTFSWVLFVEVI